MLVAVGELTQNLGTIPEGGVDRIFRFRNDGPNAVFLLPAVTSCACNKVDYSTTELRPGEVLAVTANFNPQAQPGKIRTHFFVPWTSATGSGRMKCVIEATVETALKMYPAVVEIEPRNGAEAMFEIERRHGESRPVHVTSNRVEITAEIFAKDSAKWAVRLAWQDAPADDTRLPPLKFDGAFVTVNVDGIGRQQYRVPVRVRRSDELNKALKSFKKGKL